MSRPPLAAATTLALCGCGASNTGSNAGSPDTDTTAQSKALETGAAGLQDGPPLEALNACLDGFHFYNGNMRGQMEAHHCCGNLHAEVPPCVIYDGNTPDAKIMGVEHAP